MIRRSTHVCVMMASLVSISLASASMAAAQDAPRTVTFGDADRIEGQVARSAEELISGRTRGVRTPLIRVRTDFQDAMQRSVQNH